MSRTSRRRAAGAFIAAMLACIALAVLSSRMFVSVIAIVLGDAYLLGFADGKVVLGRSIVTRLNGIGRWDCFDCDLPSGISIRSLDATRIDWIFRETSSSGIATEWCYAIPSLLPIVVFAMLGALFFYFSRMKPGTCGKCGYELNGGLTKCPECGTQVQLHQPQS